MLGINSNPNMLTRNCERLNINKKHGELTLS
jgi:hypothetical protein